MKRKISFNNIANIILVFVLIGFGVAYVIVNKSDSGSYNTSAEWVRAYAEWHVNAPTMEFKEENFSPDGKYGEPFGKIADFCQNRFGDNWEVLNATNWRGLVIIVMHGLATDTNEIEMWVFAIAYDEYKDKMVLIDTWEFEETSSG